VKLGLVKWGGMSFWHLLLLFLILLFVMGPNKIEGIGVSLGRAIRGFKKGLHEGEEEAKTPNQNKSENPA
jgi:sec-independent protein translocase protein TatA